MENRPTRSSPHRHECARLRRNAARMHRYSVGCAFRSDVTRHRTPMEFQEYAAQEVSALIERLVSDAEARAEAVLAESQQEHDAAIAAVRAALEAQARELDARTRETERLTAEAEETRSQLAALRAETEGQRAEALRREADQQRRFAAATKAAEQERLT